MELYRTVDGWLRSWQLPMDPTGQTPLPAAAVTLRLDGEVVGRGSAVAPDLSGGSGILQFAAKKAMDEASVRVPIPRDALFEDTLRGVAAGMTLSVELAGRPVPITPNEYADAVNLVAQGLEGVAVRIGDRVDAFFPSMMTALGLDAGRAIGVLVARISSDPTLGLERPADLREKHGVGFYRFAVTHLAQTTAHGQPAFLHRGGRLVALRDMDVPGLHAWAQDMVRHLAVPVPADHFGGPLPGALNPMTAERDPLNVNLRADDLRITALTAAALLTYCKTPGVSPAMRQRAFAAAEYYLTGLTDAYDVGAASLEPVGAALTQWAMYLYTDNPHLDALPTSNLQHVTEISHHVLWGSPTIVKPATEDAPAEYDYTPARVPEGAWKGPGAGEVAAGMVRSSGALHPSMVARGGELARAAVRKSFLGSPNPQLVTQMPWLGWAELVLCGNGEIPSAAALREMRSLVWQHQLKAEDLPPQAADLAGGIMFTSSRQPLPTAQSARPLAFIATMLGDPRLTEPGEIPAEIVRLMASLRFLRQLTASEAEAHMYRDPSRAIGGVRLSLFDQRMPPEATAMTLLTVCETLRSLEAIRQRQAAGE